MATQGSQLERRRFHGTGSFSWCHVDSRCSLIRGSNAMPGTKDRPEIHARFREIFGGDSRLFRAPGRVNIIGEHTDYNDGFVMPAAIAPSCWVAAAPRGDDKLSIYSANYAELCEADLLAPLERRGKWFDYPLGVAWALRQSGLSLPGANMYIFGEVP